jgi:type II secretory pathway component PulF
MIIGFMLFVIPKVQKMYSDAKVNLPSLTQHVINISEFLQKNYIFLVAILFIIIFLIRLFKNHPKTQIKYDKFVLQIPLF